MTNKLASERMIVEEPTSFTGSAKRIWRMTETDNTLLKTVMIIIALILLPIAWSLVLCWYLIFGIFLLPWRFFSRSKRRSKIEAARHREMLEAMNR